MEKTQVSSAYETKKSDSEPGVEFTVRNILNQGSIASPNQVEGNFSKGWKMIEEKFMLPMFVKEEESPGPQEKSHSAVDLSHKLISSPGKEEQSAKSLSPDTGLKE